MTITPVAATSPRAPIIWGVVLGELQRGIECSPTRANG